VRPPARARTHDELRDTYRRNVSAVYAFFSYYVGEGPAEDLTAATFERVVRSWGTFDRSLSSARTWTLAIARNILIDHHRRQQHRIGPSLDEHPALCDSLAAADDPLARRLAIDGAKEWLRELSPRQLEVVALRYGADLTAAEIAGCLGLTEANVHQISSRALRRMREVAAERALIGSA
jgi:RNA polymerase sigma-70 factor, ECF subfamily